MTNRTIHVIGQGYSPTPVSVVATLDGNVAYSGTIPTVNENISVTKGSTEEITALQQALVTNKTSLFSFETDLIYNGIKTVNIEVSGGPVWFGIVIANYVEDPHVNPSLTPEQTAIVENPASTRAELEQIRFDIASPPFTSGEIAAIQESAYPYPADIQLLIRQHNAEIRYNSSGPDVFMRLPDFVGSADDTWTSVSINGVDQPINPDAYDPPLNGTWWWTLYPGDVFTGALRIVAGVPTP